MTGKLKPFVNDPLLWQEFNKYLDEKIQACYKNMDQYTELQQFFREQGKVEVYKRLKLLRSEVNGVES